MLDDSALLRAAERQYDRRYTMAGRALAKHGTRPNSVFPAPSGAPDRLNETAARIVAQILADPSRSVSRRHHGRFGMIMDIRSGDGRGVRFSVEGDFIGFLEP